MTTTPPPRPPKPRLRWLQFSLRTLMIVFFLVGPISAWVGPPLANSVTRWLYPEQEERDDELIFTERELRDILKKWESIWNGEKPDRTPAPIKGGAI